MKLYCERESLLSDTQLALAAVATRDIKPILKNLKAIAAGDKCTLMATDLEMGIRLELRSPKVQEPGAAILPAARFSSILREATDEHLTVEADGQRCVVTGAQNEFEMPGEDPEEFPDVPSFSDKQFHEVTAGVLRTMIRRTIFATAKESTRYAMTGVVWELEGDHCRLIATDSKRLALTSGQAKSVGGHDTKGQSHIVPTKAMALLERNLHDDEETVKIALKPNDVLFRTERATIYSRLVEGRFPPYKEILPKKANARIPLAVGPFLTAVRQAAIMTDDESKRVNFHFASKKLTLAAHGAAAGRSKVELALEYDGAPIEIAFDPSYLVDMLKVLAPEDPLSLELNDGSKPALFKSGSDYQYLVMPLS
jgi:DNA polymerase III subunit beta